ncbi:MAG: hypothetical protein CR977_03585 [Gammaproteobacteria bacterium]|nr:MAG: hypothetical protein CR977_03585 [Gammaproteobacteria bacterium]
MASSNIDANKCGRKRQRGVSLLMALTLLLLVTSIIAGVALNSNYAIRRSAMITHLTQAEAYAAGALNYAERILQTDSYVGNSDDASEDWAQRLPPYPVTGGTVVGGHINELSSRFNLANLVVKDPFEIRVFKRLWQHLGGNAGQAERLIATVGSGQYVSVIGAMVAANIDESTLNRVSHAFVYLPINAEKMNINLVSAPVFAAYFDLSVERAEAMLSERQKQPILSHNELLAFAQRHGIAGTTTDPLKTNAPLVINLRFDIKSRYFQAVAHAQIGDASAVAVATLDRGGQQMIRLNQRLSRLADE